MFSTEQVILSGQGFSISFCCQGFSGKKGKKKLFKSLLEGPVGMVVQHCWMEAEVQLKILLLASVQWHWMVVNLMPEKEKRNTNQKDHYLDMLSDNLVL